MADKKISALTAAALPLAGTEVLPIVQSGSTVKVASNDLTVRNVRANATTGLLQVTGPTAGTTRVMTTPDANFTVARTDVGQLFNGNQVVYEGKLTVGITGQTLTALEVVYPNVGTRFAVNYDNYSAVIEAYNGGGVKTVDIKATGTSNFGGGDVSVGAGNVVIGTANKGIDFSANTHAAGMTSELLNDYEEGTWTPTVSSSVGTITSVTATGKYTKIGRQVTIEISLSVTNNGTGSDSIRIGGLPYTAESTAYAGSGFNTSSGETSAVGFAATNTLVVYKYNATYPVTTGQGLAIVVTYFV